MNVERFRQIMDSYSVSFEIFHLETLLFQDPSHLDKLVVSCKSATAKSDLMRILTRMALVKVAILRGFSKVFVGDNCTRLAVDIISDTCTGRGVNLPWKYATCQKYLLDSEGVVIVRPLRDLVDLEIKYYLESIIETYPETALPRLDSPKEPSDSIYALTDSITLSMV